MGHLAMRVEGAEKVSCGFWNPCADFCGHSPWRHQRAACLNKETQVQFWLRFHPASWTYDLFFSGISWWMSSPNMEKSKMSSWSPTASQEGTVRRSWKNRIKRWSFISPTGGFKYFLMFTPQIGEDVPIFEPNVSCHGRHWGFVTFATSSQAKDAKAV